MSAKSANTPKHIAALRGELLAIANRRAVRVDRLMAELGACDAVVQAYNAVADAFASVGAQGAAHIYRIRAQRAAELCVTQVRRRAEKPTVPCCTDTPRCPSHDDVTARPGFVGVPS